MSYRSPDGGRGGGEGAESVGSLKGDGVGGGVDECEDAVEVLGLGMRLFAADLADEFQAEKLEALRGAGDVASHGREEGDGPLLVTIH